MKERQAGQALTVTPSQLMLLRRLIAAERQFGVGHPHALDSSKAAHKLSLVGYVEPYGGGRVITYRITDAGRAAVETVARLASGAR